MIIQPNVFDALRATGAKALAFTKAWFSNPAQAAGDFTQMMVRTNGPGIASLVENDAIFHSLWCNSMLCGRWAMSGFPVVNIGHRTAAAFMSTKIRPADAVEFVRIPWPAFCIRLPTPLLTVEDSGRLHDASLILVTCLHTSEVNTEAGAPGGEYRWWYKMIAPSSASVPNWMDAPAVEFFGGLSLWGFNVPTEHFANERMEAGDGYTRWDTHESTDSDYRSDRMARALIVACCLYLSGDPRERATRESEGVTIKSRSSKQRPDDTLPPYTEHEIHSAITINLHHTIRDYVRHGGSAPNVQTLVSGHWKRVAYGVGREFRKLSHVQPYWRGDVDAPISTRIK
jgi:hypothetical protein